MLRIIIEDDRQQQPQQQNISAAASGGAVAPHVRQLVDRRRTESQPAVFAHPSQTTAQTSKSAINAGSPPGWLHEIVKGLVSKAAETAIKPPKP